jgi:hypothetical protein
VNIIASLTLMSSLLAAIPALAKDDAIFRFSERPGPHAVGLKVVEQYDRSRTFKGSTDALGRPFKGEPGRPLQTLVWYPANESVARRMTVGDYVNLWATETTFDRANMPQKGKQWLAGVKRVLGENLLAVKNAPPKPGRFPVVVYSPGAFGPSWDNVDLCEYLASHGYVVIGGPMMGTRTRYIVVNEEDIETPAQDISFLIGYAQSLPDTDMTEVAVVGMSWGGISALFAAARDSRIKALVSSTEACAISRGSSSKRLSSIPRT